MPKIRILRHDSRVLTHSRTHVQEKQKFDRNTIYTVQLRYYVHSLYIFMQPEFSVLESIISNVYFQDLETYKKESILHTMFCAMMVGNVEDLTCPTKGMNKPSAYH